MGRLNNSFNLQQDIRVRQFTYGGHTFKVRIPLVSENDAMRERIANAHLNTMAINAIFVKRTEGLEAFESVQVTENDIIVEGRSMKQAAIDEHKARVQITEMLNLLVPEVDDGQGPLTYEQIEAELPFSVQIELMRKIVDVISPNLEESKKN